MTDNYSTTGLGIGIAIGVVAGIAVGVAIGNVPVAMTVCLAAGIGVGALRDYLVRRRRG